MTNYTTMKFEVNFYKINECLEFLVPPYAGCTSSQGRHNCLFTVESLKIVGEPFWLDLWKDSYCLSLTRGHGLEDHLQANTNIDKHRKRYSPQLNRINNVQTTRVSQFLRMELGREIMWNRPSLMEWWCSLAELWLNVYATSCSLSQPD